MPITFATTDTLLKTLAEASPSNLISLHERFFRSTSNFFWGYSVQVLDFTTTSSSSDWWAGFTSQLRRATDFELFW